LQNGHSIIDLLIYRFSIEINSPKILKTIPVTASPLPLSLLVKLPIPKLRPTRLIKMVPVIVSPSHTVVSRHINIVRIPTTVEAIAKPIPPLFSVLLSS